MATLDQQSKRPWNSGDPASKEEINTGSFQRIALALETMAQSWGSLERDRDWYQQQYKAEQETVKHLESQIRGLRGALTKVRKRKEDAGT